jgi:hypothetical protein
MATLSVLSIAVASSKVGYVFLHGGGLQDWGITVKAAKSSSELVEFVQRLINDLRPDVVVTEDCSIDCRKGAKSKMLIASVAELASHNPVLDIAVSRPRLFQSKYEEAEELTAQYPEIAGYLPKHKRRIFDFEPRGMVLFEALALAESVTKGPPAQLAAAMG